MRRIPEDELRGSSSARNERNFDAYDIRRSVIAFALLLLSLAAVRPIARAADEPARGDYVGQLQGLERGAIAISTDGRSVLAYVCDGTAEHVTVAQWFKGTPSANTLSLGAGRATLDARLDTDRASGTVIFADGRTFAFRAVPGPQIRRPARVYFAASWIAAATTTSPAGSRIPAPNCSRHK